MSDTWKCKECELIIRSGQVFDKSLFYDHIKRHLDKHGCTCDIDSKGNRAKCARCKWYED